jgi:Ca2+-binding EF-hand superfamily protein
MDVDHTGIIESDELTDAISSLGLDISKGDIEKIINSVNFKGNGEINYSEFIASTI